MPAGPATIHCCICLNQKTKHIIATTIVKGYAVCDEHVKLVEQPGFDIFKISKGGPGSL